MNGICRIIYRASSHRIQRGAFLLYSSLQSSSSRSHTLISSAGGLHHCRRTISTSSCLLNSLTSFVDHNRESSRVSEQSTQVQNRINELQTRTENLYPRIQTLKCEVVQIDELQSKYQNLNLQSPIPEPGVLYGRVHSIRKSGSKLVFIDISQANSQLQVTISFSQMDGISLPEFRDQFKVIRKGDHISVYGRAIRCKNGQIGFKAISLPSIISPSLHIPPSLITNPETIARRRHLDLLLNPQSRDLLRLRSRVDSFLRSFLDSAGFTSVSTPIITFGTGGAQARPFETRATEFSDLSLSLRIAPELFLKRLVVGDMGPVYEIGPVFRNEGVDGTHNPEFTMCEFYMPYTNLDTITSLTEQLFRELGHRLSTIQDKDFPSLNPIPQIPQTPFPRIEFIPGIKRGLEEKGVSSEFSLSSPTLIQDLLKIFQSLGIPSPKPDVDSIDQHTAAKLLDSLAAHILEPQCIGPTWLIHQPALMSPLAKSFQCQQTGELVAARAELFINGTEYVNCYEEENDPTEQRRKFVLQQASERTAGSSSHSSSSSSLNDSTIQAKGQDGESPEIDESYIEALEWGLPPTAGWGCGVDRLVMYFGGVSKISDVLAFGSLRHVVTIGKSGRKGLD